MKKRILIGYRHPSVGAYSLKPTLKKRILGSTLLLTSLIIPDLGIGLVTGSILLSGVSFKTKLKSWKYDFQTWRALR